MENVKLADCRGVTKKDFEKLHLDKDISVQEYIDFVEQKKVQGNRIGKREGEVYLIAKKQWTLTLQIKTADMDILDEIPLTEMKQYVGHAEFYKSFNHIYRIAPTFGAMLRWEGIFLLGKTKVFEITALKWRKFIYDNVQKIITDWTPSNDNQFVIKHFDDCLKMVNDYLLTREPRQTYSFDSHEIRGNITVTKTILVELSADNYARLLAWHLYDEHLTINSLFHRDQSLYWWVMRGIDSYYCHDGYYETDVPHTITMKEALDDLAEIIIRYNVERDGSYRWLGL